MAPPAVVKTAPGILRMHLAVAEAQVVAAQANLRMMQMPPMLAAMGELQGITAFPLPVSHPSSLPICPRWHLLPLLPCPALSPC